MFAYIEVETRLIWFWQWSRYVRDGWTVNLTRRRGDPFLRLYAERCIG